MFRSFRFGVGYGTCAEHIQNPSTHQQVIAWLVRAHGMRMVAAQCTLDSNQRPTDYENPVRTYRVMKIFYSTGFVNH